jgi:ribose 5-phosphate isomerase A
MNPAEAQKQAAAAAAAALVEDGMTLGLGTGSTAVHFVRAVAARALKLRCVATSEATAALAASLGLMLVDLGAAGAIDLTVDGADEIGPGLALIKGGGGAMLREKLTWLASRRCVVIADAAKPAAALGGFPLPVEVVAFGASLTADRLSRVFSAHGIAAEPILRLRDGAPVHTDNGNLIYDTACGAIGDAAALAGDLKAVTGVVEHGLFLGLAERALVGGPDGVTTLYP